jgi:hypothetical protein
MYTLHGGRTVWSSRSDDFSHWSEPDVVLKPDLLDGANTELYGMAAFSYSDMYLGMLERWHGVPDVIDVQLAWSHDGARWQRPATRRAFIAPTVWWNHGWTTCASTPPIIVGNQLLFYFGGRRGAHGSDTYQRYGAVGLATLTVDRFAGIHADFKEGRLVTKPMLWPGGDLILNCEGRYPEGHPSAGGGSIAVEVWDDNNRPVESFAGEHRARYDKASPDYAAGVPSESPVRWPGNHSLQELAGRRIRLAFLLRDARLYSFRARLSMS